MDAQQSPLLLRFTPSQVLMRQSAWLLLGLVTAAALDVSGTWVDSPTLALGLTAAVGLCTLNARSLWIMPLALASAVLGGLAAELIRLPGIVGVGAVVGLFVAWQAPLRTDWVDGLHCALASLAGAAAGLWSAVELSPDPLGSSTSILVVGGLVSLGASQGMLPLMFGERDGLPTPRELRRALGERYRPPVLRALELYRGAARHAPDGGARGGLAEVVRWVFRLQQTLQEQDQELEAIDPADVHTRIVQAESRVSNDPFTQERQQATARHLSRLLAHRAAIATERERNSAVSDYALAFLEEARAGAAVGRILPGEAAPDRLGDVLAKLRMHAAEGEARRQTVRELQTA